MVLAADVSSFTQFCSIVLCLPKFCDFITKNAENEDRFPPQEFFEKLRFDRRLGDEANEKPPLVGFDLFDAGNHQPGWLFCAHETSCSVVFGYENFVLMLHARDNYL